MNELRCEVSIASFEPLTYKVSTCKPNEIPQDLQAWLCLVQQRTLLTLKTMSITKKQQTKNFKKKIPPKHSQAIAMFYQALAHFKNGNRTSWFDCRSHLMQ